VRHDGSARDYHYADEIALVPFLFVDYADLEAEPDSGRRYYVFTNQIGVPIRVEDDAGKACWSARIDPFGQAHVSRDSTLDMPLRFPGHYFDPETGLHYNRFRYFSPELGRYLQSDPAGLWGGINLYAYPDDPLTGADIDGLAKGRDRGQGGRRRSGQGGAEGRRKGQGGCDDDMENEGVEQLEERNRAEQRKRERAAAEKQAAEAEAKRKAGLSDEERAAEAEATRARKAAEAAAEGPTGPQLGDRAKVGDDKQQKLEEIQKAQQAVRQGKSNQIIDNTQKSEQAAKTELARIKSQDDAPLPDSAAPSTPPPPPADTKPKDE
jgi:RHS repeat-associated protein